MGHCAYLFFFDPGHQNTIKPVDSLVERKQSFTLFLREVFYDFNTTSEGLQTFLMVLNSIL